MGIYEFIAIKKDIRDNQQGVSMSMVVFEQWWGITTTPVYQPTNLPLIDKRERMFEEWIWEKGPGVVDSNSKTNILKQIMIFGRQNQRPKDAMDWVKSNYTKEEDDLWSQPPRWRKNIEARKN
jgi:hypothetical protein